MKQKRFGAKKTILIACAVLLLLVVALTATGVFASLADTTKVITVREGDLGCEVGKDYVIRGTGTVPALLRAKIVVNWLDEEGNVLAVAPEGAAVSVRAASGWTLVQVDGHSLGWGKTSAGTLKNHYPKGLRRK